MPVLARNKRISYYLTACDVPNIIIFKNKTTIAIPFDDDKWDDDNVPSKESIEYSYPTRKLAISFSRREFINRTTDTRLHELYKSLSDSPDRAHR